MLVISHANGIYKISVGLFTAQGRTLEKALKNALEKQNGLTPPDDLIYATASVLSTLVGVLLLQLIFNLIVFENGRDVINISSYWESVIRGAFLLVVVLLQARLVRRRSTTARTA